MHTSWRITLIAASAAVLAAEDWTRFRGPNGTGVSAEAKLPGEMDKSKGLAWKVETPAGNSSPIVVKGRVLFTGHDGTGRFLLCYEAASGKQLWRAGMERPREEHAHPINGPTTPTPATDGKLVYAFFPDFGVAAFDLDGKPKWKTPLGPFGAIQGIAASPVIVEGHVVIQIDTPEEAYLAAFDAKNGKQAWKVERPLGFLGSYATPSVFKPANGPLQLIAAGAVELTGYQARTGEKLWWARGITVGPAVSPLVAGDAVYTAEPSGGGAPSYQQMLAAHDADKDGKIQLAEIKTEKVDGRIMYRLFKSIDKLNGNNDGVMTGNEFETAFPAERKDGGMVRVNLGGAKGDVAKTHAGWRQTKGIPYLTSPVLYQGVLYSVRDGGILAAYDPESGKVLREDRLKGALGQYYASPVAGDGKLYFVSKEGKISIVKAGAQWELIGSGDLDEQVIATPAISGGRIFVRTGKALYCFRG